MAREDGLEPQRVVKNGGPTVRMGQTAPVVRRFDVYLDGSSGAHQGEVRMNGKIGLDATDIRILGAVQKHGQLSKTKLAELVNLSPTPCWARLTRLRTAGFIRGYHADIALERIADFTQVIVTVSLVHHRRSDFEKFETRIRSVDEVTHCVATGGGMDYVMTVVAPSLAVFQRVMDDLLEADLNIDRYVTYFATRQVKSGQPNVAKLAARPRD